jgi:FKBP-type peptidyl-prolyl cis-trans isomerase
VVCNYERGFAIIEFMKKLSKNQWIAVVVSLVVIVLFFTTGHTIVSFFSNQGQINPNTEFMADTNTSFSSSVSGFEVIDLVEGTGETAVAGKTISVHYTGALTDGRVFDSSVTRGTPFEFPLGAGMVIQGWERGFDGMKVGGKRRLVIPAELGYGAAGAGGGLIPPNATLIFEVELLDVK